MILSKTQAYYFNETTCFAACYSALSDSVLSISLCLPPQKKESVPTEVEIVSARCRRCQYPDAHPTEAQCHSGRPLLHVRYKVSQGRLITHSCKFSYHDIAPLLPP